MIPARGPIVDEFFLTVPGWFFDMCMIPLELKTHLPFRIYYILYQFMKFDTWYCCNSGHVCLHVALDRKS